MRNSQPIAENKTAHKKTDLAELVEALSFSSTNGKEGRKPFDKLREIGWGVAGLALALTACSSTPPPVTERDMQGVFSSDGASGQKELLAEFLPDGRFGGDLPEPGGIIRTQGYWRVGALDEKRGCTIIETKPQQGEWREGYCASIENERTALNCTGENAAKTCLMTRKPRPKSSETMKIGASIPAER